MDQIHQSDEIIENTSIKICVIGPEGVGKSTIINQLCGREFDSEIKTTTCYKIDSVDYKIKNNDITINFWDCGAYHDKSYEDVKYAFYRGSLLALIIFDVNDFDTLKNELDYWIDDCDEFGACQKYIIINKIDSLEQISYQKTNKTISIGFSIEEKEQIQLTDLKDKPPTEYLADISNFLNDSKIKYIFGSAKQQGYQKNIINFINENSIYNLQKYESDKRGLKKKEQTQSFINNVNVSQSGKCIIQ